MSEVTLATCTDHCCTTLVEHVEPRRIDAPKPGFMR